MKYQLDTSLLKDTCVYVVHALKGYEYHEKRVKELFKRLNLDFEFVSEGDPSQANHEVLTNYFTESVIKRKPTGGISCTLNHMHAYNKLVQSRKKYAIIFENDPCFLGNFLKKLEPIYSEMQQLDNSFIISLENTTLTFPSFFQTKKNKLLYQATAGRMAGAYIIDKYAAQNALNDLKTKKCNDIIDWWHNNLTERGVLKMYWAHPPLVEQGSHNGIMSSVISTQKRSTARRISWVIQKIYKMYIRRLFKQARIIEPWH